MPTLHGWTTDQGSNGWTYGGRYFVAFMWREVEVVSESTDNHLEDTWFVSIWPRLGGTGDPDPTKPLGSQRSGMSFPTEAEAREYVESWERARR